MTDQGEPMKLQAPGRRPSVLRKAAFYGGMILLVYAILEGVSWIAYTLVAEPPFSFSMLQTRRTRLINAPDAPIRPDTVAQNRPRFLDFQTVHPYVGYVIDPTAGRADINAYGFQGPPLPIDRAGASADTVFVAVLGGSVAWELVRNARPTLRDELRLIERFAGKEIFVVNLGLGGMKQPQQLMIVNYFLSLGAHFDLVINLDGFNDVVLPAVENASQGTFPFYPRGWKVRVAGLADPVLLREVGRLAYLESLRVFLARLATRVRHSVTANVFWDRLDLGLQQTIENKRRTITLALLNGENQAVQGRTYAETGPERTYPSDEARYRDLAAYWKRSSVLLNRVARSNGFQYFHYLQPNQYVSDSKIFSEEERAIAVVENHPYAEAARQGYPALRAAGRDLKKEGINYTDLTMLFAGNDEVLYNDACCHFNQRGYDLIARAIARTIREHLDGP